MAEVPGVVGTNLALAEQIAPIPGHKVFGHLKHPIIDRKNLKADEKMSAAHKYIDGYLQLLAAYLTASNAGEIKQIDDVVNRRGELSICGPTSVEADDFPRFNPQHIRYLSKPTAKS